MKKTNLSLGSKNSHQKHQKSSQSKMKSNSCNKSEKISKYFLKNTSSEPKSDINDDCESPYKHLISDIKTKMNDSTSDDNDFKTPKPIRKFAPVKEKKNVSTRARTRTKQTKLTTKPGTTTIDLDVNVDHLQMAIALSKSSFEAENPEQKLEEDPSETTILKMATMKATLEQFGFKSNKPLGPRKPSQTAKRKKPSKFKYITPTLMSRTQEERETLINEKITQILSQNLDNPSHGVVEIDFQLCTGAKNFVAKKSRILLMNKQMVEDFEYLVENLGISQTGNNCGVHLKDWGQIAGRDKSPIPRNSVEIQDSPTKKVDRSVSPDLFASDDEYPPVSSPIKAAQPEDVLDLTQSSDEEEKVSTSRNEDFKRSKDYYNLDFSDEEIKEEEHITSIKSLCTQNSFSVDLEDNSFGYNTTKSLNVTDYVTQMLKEEVNTTQTENTAPLKNKDKIEIISDTEDEDQDSNYTCAIDKKDVDSSEAEDNAKDQSLNVTDYVTQMLKEDRSSKEEVNTSLKIELENENHMEITQTENKAPLKNRDKIEIISDTEDQDSNYSCAVDKKDVDLGEAEDNTEDQSLNVTDYVTQMLKEDRSVKEEVNTSLKIEMDDENHMEITQTGNKALLKNRDKIEIISDTEDEDQDSNYCCAIDKKDVNFSEAEDNTEDQSLNVTDYVTQMLKEDKSVREEINKSSKIVMEDSQNEITQTKDIVPLKKRNKIEIISDTEDEDQDSNYSLTVDKMDVHFSDEDEYQDNYCPVDKMDVSLSQTDNRDKIETISDAQNADQDSKMDVSQTEEINISSSQESSISLDLDLSLNDEELNYSSHFATPFKNHDLDAEYPGPSGTPVTHYTDCGPSSKSFNSRKSLHDQFLDDSFGKMLDNTEVIKEIEKVEENVATPSKVIIKTDNVTPMPNYDSMNTPKIIDELNKYGLKPLKRTRGVQILKHIYDSMHPFAPEQENEDLPDTKRRKTDFQPVISEKLLQNENPEDLIFERKQSSKIKSCKIPLQIVWHNFLTNNPQIMESILLYEPLQLEVIHGMLKEEGFKFHIEDLLTFLDKKCITIRTAQGKQHTKR